MINENIILVTGAAGYIGTHTCVELLNKGYCVIGMDNFSNSSPKAIERVKEITGKEMKFYHGDLLDQGILKQIFTENKVNVVIHFAGLKAVGESVEKPLKYFENNVMGSIHLFDAMKSHGVNKIVFSSSATVYGLAEKMPVDEEAPLGVTNPYGRTKLMIEEMLSDIALSDQNWKNVILRYFNPIGAHETGLIGENPVGIPNNLMPHITQVAVGKRPSFKVFGNDYETVDGTGVRDYIHVVDLAKGHVKAIETLLEKMPQKNHLIYNLGTGNGYSVLEVVSAFEKASGKAVPYEIVERRAGDVKEIYADASKAKREMGWVAEKGIEEMCATSWNWQKNNPDGYDGEA